MGCVSGVFPPHRKYLRYMFENQLYEFTALPSGLSSAPRFLTKIAVTPRCISINEISTHVRIKASLCIYCHNRIDLVSAHGPRVFVYICRCSVA